MFSMPIRPPRTSTLQSKISCAAETMAGSPSRKRGSPSLRDRHRTVRRGLQPGERDSSGARRITFPNDDGADVARLETGTFDAGADRPRHEIGKRTRL